MASTANRMNLAGFGGRVAAWIIDIFVVALPLGAVFFVYNMIYFGGNDSIDYIDSQLALMHWKRNFFRLGMLSCLLYWTLMESSARQATLGKRVMGIKVVDMEGRRISFGKAAVRALVKGLLSNIFAVGYLITLFTKNSQALHDLIAECLVVKQSPPRQSDATSPPKQEPPVTPSPSDPESEKPIEQQPSSHANQLVSSTPFSRLMEKWRNAIKGKYKTAVLYSLITIFTLSVIIIVGLIIAGISVSKDYALYEQVPSDMGRVYFVAKNYPHKGAMWRLAAICGNSKASFFIGKYYDSEIPQDGKQPSAVKWYTWAALLGNSNAQVNLGILYLYGNAVDQNDEKAFKWFRRAALQSDDEGQYRLGQMYYNRGSRLDYMEAAKWLRKAAYQGNADAQAVYGGQFYAGFGVEKNYEQAANWTRNAAAQGNLKAQYNLGVLYMKGEGVSNNIVAANAMFKKAAEQGYADACMALERCGD